LPQISSQSLHPVCSESYAGEKSGPLLEYLLIHLQSIFGIPTATISSAFRETLRHTMEHRFPRLRRSAARAILEGKVPGVPNVIVGVPNGVQGHLKKTLQLLDLLETIHSFGMEEDAFGRGDKFVPQTPSEKPLTTFRILSIRKWQCVTCAAIFTPIVEVRSLDGICPSCAQQAEMAEAPDGLCATATG